MKVRSLRRVAAGLTVATALIVAAAPASQAWPRPDRTPPTAPTGLQATAVTQTSVSLSWNRSTDNVRVTSYTVFAAGTFGVVSVAHPETTATLTGLRPGQTYTFGVVAYDAQFNSSPVALLDVTTRPDTAAPTAPSDLTVVAVDGSKVRLHWTNGTDDFGPATHEVLVDGVVTPNAWSTNTPGTPTTWAEGAWIRHLEPGTTYQFAVRARDGSGNVSAPSGTVTATTAPSSDTQAPTTPALLRASSMGTSACPEEVDVRWTGATDDVQAATAIEYEVWINGAINDVWAGITQAQIYTEVNGPNEFMIVAVDRAGNASAPSNAITERINMGSSCAP